MPKPIPLNSQYTPKMLAYLQAHFSYDPATGIITRNSDKKQMGSNLGGYLRVDIRVKLPGDSTSTDITIRSHRLAWLLHYGELPRQIIDHIDRNKSNNSIANLRLATPSTNRMNSGVGNNGQTSSYRGVTWNKERGCWQAFIYKDNSHIYIGSFSMEVDAANAYVAKAKELFPGIYPGEFIPRD